MMADIGADEDIVCAFVLDMSAKYLLVSRHGNGFIISGESCLAQTKNGKQVMNVDAKNPAHMCIKVTGDTIAMSGSNDKLLIFATSEIPEMSRGKGVILQKYNAERTYVLDAMFFDAANGFGWTTGRGTTKMDDWSPWRAKRASQGRTVPVGFPRSGKFGK
jgi:topoisomerase-4 subunit A